MQDFYLKARDLSSGIADAIGVVPHTGTGTGTSTSMSTSTDRSTNTSTVHGA